MATEKKSKFFKKIPKFNFRVLWLGSQFSYHNIKEDTNHSQTRWTLTKNIWNTFLKKPHLLQEIWGVEETDNA